MKTKVSRRTLEMRIKRELAGKNQKFKKKGNKYSIIDCENNTIIDVHYDIAILANGLNCLANYEEVDQKAQTFYALDLATKGADAALNEIVSILGIDYFSFNEDFEEKLTDRLSGFIFALLKANQATNNFPKDIDIIFDSEALERKIVSDENKIRNRFAEIIRKNNPEEKENK